MTSKKSRRQADGRLSPSAKKQTRADSRQQASLISARWLLTAIAATLLAAGLCAWASLCLLFWQGSWQLLYHPASKVTQSPHDAGLPFEPVGFDATQEGIPQLAAWWIPAAPGAGYGRFTVLLLHGETGNLGDTVSTLTRLHTVGLNVFAIDYRGYGQSQFVRPSEQHLLEDVESSLNYLTATRHIPENSIVLFGEGLGSNLALEVAAAHPNLAGAVLQSPRESPTDAIFNDGRARLVPAHLLVRDRYDLDRAAAGVHLPVLWFEMTSSTPDSSSRQPEAFRRITTARTMVWLNRSKEMDNEFTDALSRWLDDLPHK
jgi:uncharacterized protein